MRNFGSMILVTMGLVGFAACSSDDADEHAHAAADTAGSADGATADIATTDVATTDDDAATPDAHQDDAGDSGPPPELLAEYILPGDEAFPEGVTFDPVTRRFFHGSMALGNVSQTHADGTTEEFFAGNGGTDWIILGLETDPVRRRLWVCAAFSTALSESEVWVLDLDSGERLWQQSLEGTHVGAACTDMILAEDGTAYLCDRENPNLYIADFDNKTTALLTSDPLLGSAVIGLNGIAFAPDNSALLTVVFAPGALIRISLDDPSKVTEVVLEGVTDLFGIDAIAVHDGAAYMVTDSQLIRATTTDNWATATTTSFPLNSGGYSGLTVAEGALYASKSEVTKFAFGAAPDLPFKLSRIDVETAFD